MTKRAEKLPVKSVHEGEYGHVAHAPMPDGSYPSEGFWKDILDGNGRAMFMARFAKITSNPRLELRNDEQFKKVEGTDTLFAFKVYAIQSRIFACRCGSVWCLVHGFIGKKENELPPGELKRALENEAAARRAMGITK